MAIGIVVVKQYEKMVVLKWGKHDRTPGSGLRIVIPVVETGRIVDLRERVQRVPTQKYITSDNVVVDLDFVIYWRILPEEAEKSILNVENVQSAVVSLSVAILRSVIGSTTLASALAERERVTGALQIALDDETGRWGVKVTQVAINEIDPPVGGEAGHGEGEIGSCHKDSRYHRIRRSTSICYQPSRGRKTGGYPFSRGTKTVGDSDSRGRPTSCHPQG